MRKQFLTILIFILAALLVSLVSCSNPDGESPNVPDIQGTGGTTPMDPAIPEPFAAGVTGIYDIAIEGDGDIAFGSPGGVQLFTPYGVFKRNLPGSFLALATSNYSNLDTGRGVTGLNTDECRPANAFDDQYVQGGVFYHSYDPNWWAGDPDPYNPDVPIDFCSSSSFTSCDCFPHPIAYQLALAPTYLNYLWQKVFTPECVGDGDVPWPLTDNIPINDSALIAYHPDAPLPPDYMSRIFEGGVDYLVYYDYPTFMNIQNMAGFYGLVPACAIQCNFIVWDLTDMNYMSSRSGMTTSNICDFEFDSLNRLIWAMPNADSVCITDPVVFGDPIIVQQVLGGRQNGMGTLPGEFQGPTAIAIDPRNQNILVSDTGNGRVQVFDNDGNFIREFGGADGDFTPGPIRVDAFGTIYVVNDPIQLAGEASLRLYNENGSPVVWGTIEGWVYDKETLMPIDNAAVRVQSTFLPLDTFTDDDGHFMFDAVPNGTHNLTAEKYGYNGMQVNVQVTGGYKSNVDFYLERTMTQPPGYGQVTGTVMSSQINEPVPGLTAQVVGLGVSNTTNGNGEFTLHNVDAGDHIFRLTSDGTVWYEQYITVTPGGILDLGTIYVPTW